MLKIPKEQIDRALDFLIGTWGLVIGISSIALGIYLEPNFFGHLLKELGIAVVILTGIGLTLEKRHRDSFRDEMNDLLKDFRDNAFQALFDWVIPKKYLAEVENQILRDGLIRENFEIEYFLRPIHEGIRPLIDETCNTDNRIFVEVKVRYKVRNAKQYKQNYPLACFIEKEDAPNFNSATHINIINERGETRTLNADELAPLKDGSDEINNCYALDDLTISGEGYVDVEINYRAIRGYSHTREVFSSYYVADGVKVRVNSDYPRQIIRCQVFSPGDLIEVPVAAGTYAVQKYWVYNSPLLPQQAIMIWWHSDFEMPTGN